MTDQQILMTDPIPLCWAEPSELAWHPASESDPKGFLTLKGELVIEPPFIVHHFGELLVPPIIDVRTANAVFRLDPVSEDRFFPPYPILNHFETWHRARDENNAESRDELERRIEVDLFKLVQVVDFLILWCDDYYLRHGRNLSIGKGEEDILQDISLFYYQRLEEEKEKIRDLIPNIRRALFRDHTAFRFLKDSILLTPLISHAQWLDASQERRFHLADGQNFTPRPILTTTLCTDWSPALFAAVHPDGSQSALFSQTEKERQRLMAAGPDEVEAPERPLLRKGREILDALRFLNRIEKLRPTAPTVTPQQALAADSLCQWLSDTVARYLILAEQQLIVSELLDPSAIHYPGPIPVDEILKEYPLGLR